MRIIRLLSITFGLILTIASCNGNPEPQPPITPILEGVLHPGVPPHYVPRNTGGEYEVLPSVSVIVRLSSGYPGQTYTTVTIDGNVLEYVDSENITKHKDVIG